MISKGKLTGITIIVLSSVMILFSVYLVLSGSFAKAVSIASIIIGGVLFALFLLFLESSAGGATMTVRQVFDVAEDFGEAVAFANLTQILLNRPLLTYFIMFIPSFIIGYDFDGGMIRNKIMAGYSRIQIYFSSLIASFVTCLFYGLFMFIYNVVVYVNAFTPEVILKWMSLPESGEIIIAAAIFNFFIIFALCAVSVAIMMMLNNKVLSIVFVFVVMLVVIVMIVTKKPKLGHLLLPT